MDRTNESVYELLTKDELLEIRDKIEEEFAKDNLELVME